MIELSKLDDEEEIEKILIGNAYFQGKNLKNQENNIDDILKYP
jgi:hypothetical protein